MMNSASSRRGSDHSFRSQSLSDEYKNRVSSKAKTVANTRLKAGVAKIAIKNISKMQQDKKMQPHYHSHSKEQNIY